MNERIQQLAKEYGLIRWDHDSLTYELKGDIENLYEFAQLIVRECVNTLEFHGFDDAVPYIQWMATNKLGVEE